MTILLDPDEIKQDQSESAEESRQRARSLAAEETRLAKAINQARADADAEIEIIEEDLKAFKIKATQEQTQLESDIARLKDERSELLKPIDEIKATANRILAEATERAGVVENQAKIVEADRQKVMEWAEDLTDKEDSITIKEQKLDSREQAVKAEEERSRQSSEKLAQKWVEYHKAVAILNQQIKDVQHLERVAQASQKANEIKQKEIDAAWAKIELEKQGIKARYEELIRARIQLFGH